MVLNARDAADRGATIRTRAKVVSARARGRPLGDHASRICTPAQVEEVTARLLVNAAGPWVDHVLSGAVGQNDVHNVRLVQGSHIVVAKKFDDPRAYFFQNEDGRIIFAIPYEGDFTLIGTTDQRLCRRSRTRSKISEAEIDYLCAAASEYFAKPVRREDIVWTYSGVRPLYDDGASKAQEATRDYVLKADGGEGEAPLVNIFGGKITTYRRLVGVDAGKDRGAARQARASRGRPTRTLPGGDFPATGFDAQCAKLKARLSVPRPRAIARRLVRLYGTRAHDAARPRQVACRPRPAFRRRSLRGRGPLSDGARMGA